MYAIQAQGLKKAFGNINAVDDVSFDVKKGEIFGFLGPNGAGKTTTIRMLTGILPPDSGHIEIEGIDIVKDGMHAKAKIGVIPETGNVYTDLTAKQNLSLAGKFYG
ncbi:MAG: ABC transporter ATP-binding protein, partial [Candidatus Methanofastidiosa archaeon]|nr:ABC transporter ATP-binding protein [Candidatus Methanofastidiosa archaeon]